jgi:hypothetical protein
MTSIGERMKTKSSTFLSAFTNIVLNQRGSIGEEAEAAPEMEAEAVEEVGDIEPELEASAEDVPEAEGEAVEVQAETEQELESEIQEALEEGASEEEVKNMIRQFTLKVDGKEIVKELDLNDEEAVKRELQLSYKGRQSMQELQELKNTYASELQRLMDNPFEVLKELNGEFDPLEYSAEYIDKLAKEQEMTPEQKADAERQRDYEEIKAERDRLKADAEEKVNEASRVQMAEEIQSDIMTALEADNELVADRETVALIANELYWAAEKKMFDITAKDVIPTVKAQLKQNFQKMSTRFKSPEIMKDYMGKELLDKLREERVAQAKQQVKGIASIDKGISKPSDAKEAKKEKINLSSLFR